MTSPASDVFVNTLTIQKPSTCDDTIEMVEIVYLKSLGDSGLQCSLLRLNPSEREGVEEACWVESGALNH